MKSLTFIRATLIGLGLSLLGSISFYGLQFFYTDSNALQLTISLVALVYIGTLLAYSKSKAGRLTTILVCLVGNIALLYLFLPINLLIISILLSVWLVRTLYHHQRFIASVLDAGLLFAGYSAAVWTLFATGSWFLSFWLFFLIQALTIFIPQLVNNKRNAFFEHFNSEISDLESSDRDFHTAYRNAQNAIKRLSKSHQ
ncbi:hypothetical protein [Aliikangiella coralliicola]|uniref:Uncharacterized protein n=1 Tax=Aliikangiella coralliicola TaxID=2592383 RepID=A0A545UEU8_9GAMM|nr:hypothetical protein [Aliikangiella coralliicola]TQV87999.1 hypothetical protein FLL46_09305 [Aliikangiella coralliicola]